MSSTTKSPDNAPRAIDPFGFFVGYASCIKSLGGPERGPDPAYAFHTPYLEYRPGALVFTLRFRGLHATFGELEIHVNSFVPDSGANALLVTSARVSIVELARGGAEINFKINALPNVSFAIFGWFPEGTDASAASLTITAEELGEIENHGLSAEALQPTRFGAEDLLRPEFMVGDKPPSFARPVSQLMTPAQLEQDAYRERVRQMPASSDTAATAWERAFVLQALDCYGLLQPGAKGLVLGDDHGLASLLAAHGCDMTIGTDDDQPAIDPAAPSAADNIAIRRLAISDLPDDLRSFDFCWSIAAGGPYRTASDARSYIIGSLRSLRPGAQCLNALGNAPNFSCKNR